MMVNIFVNISKQFQQIEQYLTFLYSQYLYTIVVTGLLKAYKYEYKNVIQECNKTLSEMGQLTMCFSLSYPSVRPSVLLSADDPSLRTFLLI